jgi:hypothetical protein
VAASVASPCRIAGALRDRADQPFSAAPRPCPAAARAPSRVRAVLYGHLHIRTSVEEDGVQFQEVSLGYSRQWDQRRMVASYLRVIL